MLLTITFLIVTTFAPAQPTHVADLHPTTGPTIQLYPQPVKGVLLKPAQPTVVKTWTVQ